MTEIRKTYCRICQGFCAMEATIEDGKVTRVLGDKSNPMTRGYACFKGLRNPEFHHGPERITASLKRGAGGALEPIPSERAFDEIADRLRAIIDEDGPRAVAVFIGTQGLFAAPNPGFAGAFTAAIGSPSLFGTMTIDQSAKWIASGRIGEFGGGPQPFIGADVWMFVGTNPLVSVTGGPGLSGFNNFNPVKSMEDARAAGMKLIVVDPRRTETARHADIFIQPRPGEDAAILASMIHVILAEGWEDRNFCERHVTGLEALRDAVRDFTPECVAARADIPAVQIVEAADLFARRSRTGMAGSGTGPDMAKHSNLSEHLVQCLNVICGRYLRAGDSVANPGVLSPRIERSEAAVPPTREWERGGAKSRKHGLGTIKGQMMSAILPDEILHPGHGRIRALICMGANPAVALPDQRKALQALGQLDLLVAIDPRMSATARLADYIIAPTLPFERPDHTGFFDKFFPVPYAQYTPALIAPQGDVVHDWYVFWSLAKRLGVTLSFYGTPLSMEIAPTADEVLEMMAAHAQVPLGEVKRAEGGRLFQVPDQIVGPGDGQAVTRLDVAGSDVLDELATLRGDVTGGVPQADERAFPMRLVSRRFREVMNSLGADLPLTRERLPYNPAFMNPGDMAAAGLSDGERVRIVSPHDSLFAMVKADATVRGGVVSMSHCWGGFPDDEDEREGRYSATSRLVSADWAAESINRMPVMSAIPVRIERSNQ
ncbi:molybdopterin-dependent oxidoreductase [Emcibacter sp. SYSU 3D8]|uniref:molybdopterin-containing oxidoreductase family protein n=1 Tax=Emcibacter sp. SYSU 3D8 TaxID=3133969 RepID=UPI0031FE90F5